MILKLSLSMSKQIVSQFILKQFNIENESALLSLPQVNINPFDELTTIIADGLTFRMGRLPWGRKSLPHQLTRIAEPNSQSPLLIKYLKKNRCLIPISEFSIKENDEDRLAHVFKEKNNQLLLIAGLYFTTVTNNTKSSYVSILTTSLNNHPSSNTQTIPIILNPDQYRFWLNPNTLLSELNFLFLPHNFKNLIVEQNNQ
jgi:putative SOS response-associated peptidase YedK